MAGVLCCGAIHGGAAVFGGGGGAVFGTLIVCYLFLGGAGAGLCLVMTLLALSAPTELVAARAPRRRGAGGRWVVDAPWAYRRLIGAGYAVSLAVLALGIVCLLADVGRADRVLLLLMYPTGSFIALGTWALALCAALALALACVWAGLIRLGLFVVRMLGAFALAVALVVMVYTGLLLQSLDAIPLWATPWLPVLFVLSSLSCGIALALGMAQFTGAASVFGAVLRRLAAVDVLTVALEAAAVALLIVTAPVVVPGAENGMAGTAQALEASVWTLVAGPDSWLFWGGFVGVGLALPLMLDLALAHARRPMPLLAVAAAACVLVGGFVMRFCVMGAGMHPVLMAGPFA